MESHSQPFDATILPTLLCSYSRCSAPDGEGKLMVDPIYTDLPRDAATKQAKINHPAW